MIYDNEYFKVYVFEGNAELLRKAKSKRIVIKISNSWDKITASVQHTSFNIVLIAKFQSSQLNDHERTEISFVLVQRQIWDPV